MKEPDDSNSPSQQKNIDLGQPELSAQPDETNTTAPGVPEEQQVPPVQSTAPEDKGVETVNAEPLKPEDKLLQLSTDELFRLSDIVNAVYHSDQFRNGEWEKWCTKIQEINLSDQRHGLDETRGENFRNEHRVWTMLRNHGLSHDWRPKALMGGLQMRVVNGYADRASGSYFDEHQKPVNDQERQATYSTELTTSYWRPALGQTAVNLKTGITVGDFFNAFTGNPNTSCLHLLQYPASKGDLQYALITISGAIQSKEKGSATFQESKYPTVDLTKLPPLREEEKARFPR